MSIAAVDSRKLKGKRGLQRLLNAARYSIDGFRAAWDNEDAFRQEVLLAAIMIPIGLIVPVSIVEKILLIGTVVLVLIVELLNSGIEVAIDRDSYEINPLGKRAKDLGSAAVMLALLLTAGTWAAILIAAKREEGLTARSGPNLLTAPAPAHNRLRRHEGRGFARRGLAPALRPERLQARGRFDGAIECDSAYCPWPSA
jgi:diacylglycerol kinase (ATP)